GRELPPGAPPMDPEAGQRREPADGRAAGAGCRDRCHARPLPEFGPAGAARRLHPAGSAARGPWRIALGLLSDHLPDGGQRPARRQRAQADLPACRCRRFPPVPRIPPRHRQGSPEAARAEETITGAAYLVTRNVLDYRAGPLPALQPAELLALL